MRRFWTDRKGNVAVLFALSIVPVIGGVGAAIDYSMASAYRADLQQALDSTALAMSKVLPVDEAKMNEVGRDYFFASLGPHTMTDVRLEIVPGDGKVTLRAMGDYTPAIANIFGAQKFTISAVAEAVWSMGKVEIALVLDMSLSMQTPDPARIQALRASTNDLLNVLENAAREPGDAKVAIVPFDGMINTGYNYNTRPNWVRWDWWDENAYDSIGNRCRINGSAENFNVNSVPRGTSLAAYCRSRTRSVSSCQGASGGNRTTYSGEWIPYDRRNWNGCVYDRHERDPDNGSVTLNYDVLDTPPDTSASTTPAAQKTRYPAARCYGTPPQAVTALSDDWSSLRTKANNLNPTGYTNIAIGLAWGWHVLSPTPLFTEGAAYGTEDLTKYIILMTDGYNTKNIQMEPSSCNTNGPTCPIVDARMSQVCTNIKNAGIKIYTIRLIDGNASLLRNCATSPDMYYDVRNANQLAGVFNAIGSEIASLHLAK